MGGNLLHHHMQGGGRLETGGRLQEAAAPPLQRHTGPALVRYELQVCAVRALHSIHQVELRRGVIHAYRHLALCNITDSRIKTYVQQ